MIGNLNEVIIMLGTPPALFLVAKATVVVALGLIGAWLARNSRAAVRHALLAAAFGVLLALPVASIVARPVPIALAVTKDHSIASPLFDGIAAPASGVSTVTPHSDAHSRQGLPEIRLSTILLYGWFIGGALFAILTIRGMLQVRFLRRFALPWRQGQAVAEELAPRMRCQVEVLLHETLTGPLTCGVLRPAIILPADAEGWTRQDLDRALIHELEHVRRHDWTFHCLTRIGCAVYWFHPMVWAAWRQLALEAERACDDAVLRRSEPIAYADQLLGLARRLPGAGKSTALAMASRSDLSARVGAVLDGTQRRGPVGVVLVAVTCSVAATIVLAMSPLQMVAAPQGNAPAAVQNIPKWDAVSIKKCTNPPVMRSEGQGGGANQSPDRLTLNCATLEALASMAYEIWASGQRNVFRAFATKIEGFPAWASSERYTIEAKAEGSPGQPMMMGPMLRVLLEDRFRLKVNEETREGKVFILSVVKGGPKMEILKPGTCAPASFTQTQNPAATDRCPSSTDLKDGNMKIDAWMNMDTLATLLTRDMTLLTRDGMQNASLDAPTIDKTGLADAYHVQLEYTLGTPAADAPSLPAIFTAIQKLGLKLEADKGPRQYLVFDHAERPTEN